MYKKTRKTKPRKIAYRLYLRLSLPVWLIYLVPPDIYEQLVDTPQVIHVKKEYKDQKYSNAVKLFRDIYHGEYQLTKYYCEGFPAPESKKIPVRYIHNDGGK